MFILFATEGEWVCGPVCVVNIHKISSAMAALRQGFFQACFILVSIITGILCGI